MSQSCSCIPRVQRLRESRRSLVETLLDPAYIVPDPAAERLWRAVSEITVEIAQAERLHKLGCGAAQPAARALNG